MPLPYTPDRDLNPPSHWENHEIKTCEICKKEFYEYQLYELPKGYLCEPCKKEY